jgi:hypothetical protein
MDLYTKTWYDSLVRKGAPMNLEEVAQYVKDQGWTEFFIAIIENEEGYLSLEVEVVPTAVIAITWDTGTTSTNDARKEADFLGDCLGELGLTEFVEREEWEYRD